MARDAKGEGDYGGPLPPTPPDSEQSDEEKSEHDSPRESEVNYPLPPSTIIPTEILDSDKKTPDEWLARDPRLIRLTGVSCRALASLRSGCSGTDTSINL